MPRKSRHFDTRCSERALLEGICMVRATDGQQSLRIKKTHVSLTVTNERLLIMRKAFGTVPSQFENNIAIE